MNCLIDPESSLVWGTEDIHEINREGHAAEIRVGFLTQDFNGLRVNRHDAVAVTLQVGRHDMAVFLWLSREAGHGDRARLLQKTLNYLRPLIKFN